MQIKVSYGRSNGFSGLVDDRIMDESNINISLLLLIHPGRPAMLLSSCIIRAEQAALFRFL